jgi:hypothetical protein
LFRNDVIYDSSIHILLNYLDLSLHASVVCIPFGHFFIEELHKECCYRGNNQHWELVPDPVTSGDI